MTRWRRAVIATVAASLIVGLGVLAAVAWRLRRGPIELAWLRPYVEDVIRSVRPGARFTIGAMQLCWEPQEHHLELRAVDIHITDDQGAEVLVLPAVAIQPRLGALLRGHVDLDSLTVIAPRITLVRTEAGLMLPPLAATATAPNASPLDTEAAVAQLHQLLGVAGRVAIREGELSVDDRALAQSWGLQHLRATLGLDGGRLTLQTDGQFHTQSVQVGAKVIAEEIAGGAVHATVVLDDMVPAALWSATPARARAQLPPAAERLVAALSSPIDADLAFTVSARTGLNGPLRISARGAPFSIESSDHGVRLQNGKLQLEAEFDSERDVAEIKDLTVSFADASLTLQGTVQHLSSEALLTARASVSRFPLEALQRYWPAAAAPYARQWVVDNVSRGVVSSVVATAQLNLTGSEGGADRVDISAQFDDVAVRFAPDMPRAMALRGTVSVSGADATFLITHGTLNDLEITDGTVRIDLRNANAPRVTVDAQANGRAAYALAVLDHEPVNLGRMLSLSPEDVDGVVAGRVHCAVPLDDAELTLSGEAHLEQVSLRRPINGWSIANGDLSTRLERHDINVDGRIHIAGVPVSVAIQHRLGGAAAPQLHLQARLDSDARTALGMDLGDAISGPITVNADVSPHEGGGWLLALNADLESMSLSPPVAAFGKAAGRAGRATARVSITDAGELDIDTFDVDAGGTLANGSAVRTGEGWQTLQAHVRVPQESTAATPVAVDVSAHRRGGEYAVSLRSQNAGALVALFVAGDARGGALSFDGTVRADEGEGSLQGQLQIEDLHFSSAPVLAKVLTVGSLTGLKSLVLREGVGFKSIRTDLAYGGGVVHVTDGRGQGDAMAIIARGSLDTNTQQLDMYGSLIPSYYGLNTAVQKIPLIGALVEKATGEALQVIHARVFGRFDDPTVSIETASVFTPEILRDLMQGWRSTPRTRQRSTR